MGTFDPDECTAAGCHKEYTHVLHTIVHSDGIGDFDQDNTYCLDHAVYFWGWLSYAYPGQYTIVGITPTIDEMMGRT